MAKLEGFLVDVHCTSESNLEVELDASNITWDEYRQMIAELEDCLSDIDEKYSVKSWLVKGRALRARYRRITAEDRKRKITFSPFPSRFQNLLKNTRAYVYSLIAENCLVLEKVGTRRLYLLPKHLAPFFVEAIERINEEVIEPLRRDVEEFRRSNDYLRIKQTLSAHKLDPGVLDRAVFTIGRYRIDILPVDFGYSVDADRVYEKMRRAEAVKGLELLKRELERKQRQYLSYVVSDVVTRILEICEGFDERGRKVRNPVGKVDKLMDICDDLGLEELKVRVLEPLRLICLARHRQRRRLAEKLFGKPSLREGVKEALRGLGLPVLEGERGRDS